MRVNQVLSLVGLWAIAVSASAQKSPATPTGILRLEIGERSVRQAITSATDQAVRQFNLRAAQLTARNRQHYWKGDSQFSMPIRVELLRDGKPLPGAVSKRAGDITLSFDTTGDRVFSTDYRDLLQQVYTQAKPTMDALFGPALAGGAVRVANYDAEIGDRQAVAGGYYVPNNGSGQREIRFPVYQSREAAAINFIHCLLLAYQGNVPYGFDAYQEGLVRAVAAKVARTSGALSGFVTSSLEQVLYNTYEVGGTYDWCNQRALAGTQFIAPNLIKPGLPTGGSYGGLYLLRYRMSGSAWQKVLAEYPDFAARLNAKLAADDSIATNIDKLTEAGLQVVKSVRPGNPSVENIPYKDWLARQYILDTTESNGRKLLVQPTPITSGLRTGDFGVFAIEATYFSRSANGNEQLLSGTSYPIFWDPAVSTRFTTSAQDDRMDIAASYGSIAPNFPDSYGGTNYQVPIDIPVKDQITRLFLPAGAIARPANQDSPNTFFGTVQGFVGATQVRISFNGTVIGTAPVQRGAFGALIEDANYLKGGSFVVEVIGAADPIGTRRVNKGPGDLGLDLRPTYVTSITQNIPAGVSTFGFSANPLTEDLYQALAANGTLVARYDAGSTRYTLAPDLEAFTVGNGYFVRSATAQDISHVAVPSLVPTAIALQPGWNLITTPVNFTASTTQVRVVNQTDFEQTWDNSVGILIGADFFEYQPGPVDAFSGLSETGSYVVASAFAPRKAYFVRCLAPDGVTLLFTNISGAPARSRANLSWRAKIRAIVGQQSVAAEAAIAPDNRMRSFMPPAITGGLQLNVDDAYRSVRREKGHIFRVTVTGLKKGQIVNLLFDQDISFAPGSQLRDPRRKTVTTLGRWSARYDFRAEGTTESFDLFVAGGK